jgi:SAM-dependent methyltransferase
VARVTTTLYSDAQAAALYDVLNPPGPDDAFYLGLVMNASAVLDVGCGTGRLLRGAREAGHTGRLCGVDPDPAMLELACRRRDVEWRQGTAASMPYDGEFDLAVMTGHAFQCLVGDDELRASLAAIRRSLADGGRFAFETRNPPARAWERWDAMTLDAVDPTGARIRVSYDVEAVEGDLVTFTETTSDAGGRPLRADRATLRFLGVDELDGFVSGADFLVEARYGGWEREPLAEDSAEIVTVALRAPDEGHA